MKYPILNPEKKQYLASIGGRVEGDYWFVAPKIADPFVQDRTVAVAKQPASGRQRKSTTAKATGVEE